MLDNHMLEDNVNDKLIVCFGCGSHHYVNEDGDSCLSCGQDLTVDPEDEFSFEEDRFKGLSNE